MLHLPPCATVRHARDDLTLAVDVLGLKSADIVTTKLAPGNEGTVLSRVRMVTRAAHARLESSLDLLNEQLDLDTYVRVLTRLHGFWRGWEPQIAAVLNDDAFFHPRRRLHLLVADLSALGLSRPALRTLPICPLLPIQDAAEGMGSLYVIEGSTLGGRVIQRHVQNHFGLCAGSGCAYFSGYGGTTGAMWRSFLIRLDENPAKDADRIAQAALATFEHLEWWLARSS